MIRTICYMSILVAVVLWPFLCESEAASEEIQPAVLCGDDADVAEGKSAIYSGFYQYKFEHSSFRISDRCEVWLDIRGDECMGSSMKNCAIGPKLFITVEGVVSPRGQYGHFGMWERELHVIKVLKFERIEK